MDMIAQREKAFDALSRICCGQPDVDRHARQWHDKVGAFGSRDSPSERGAEIVKFRREAR
jgi:hypothetical protein